MEDLGNKQAVDSGHQGPGESQRGIRLHGHALECVEHLDPTEYQVENGKQLFKLLDERFPQKDASDEMSEIVRGADRGVQ